MADKISLSGEEMTLTSADEHYRDVEKSLRQYFSSASPDYAVRFTTYTPNEVVEELNQRLAEAELAASFTLLASVEAAFRIDFLQRCYRRDKAEISRRFRELNRRRSARIKLDEDIFNGWESDVNALRPVITRLKAAFKFRHWLAHGRYWTPKFGRQLDYLYLYQLADDVFLNFPFLRS